MDDLDIKIINIISNNARISHEEISRILHMSRQAIHQRIKKLEENGVIKGYKSKVVKWNDRISKQKRNDSFEDFWYSVITTKTTIKEVDKWI